MAAHETNQYSTAAGNDYPAHEETYERFVLLCFIGACYAVSVAVALAVGGVKDAWWTMTAIIVVSTVVAAHGLVTGAKKPIAIMLVLSLLALAVA